MKPISLTVKKKKKPAQKNARQKKLLLRKITIASFLIMAVALPFSGWMLWKFHVVERVAAAVDNKINYAVETVSTAMGLTLKNIYLEGENFIPEETIAAQLDLKEDQPIMTIPLREIKEKLEKLEWVKEADIERQIPNTLHVRIIEKTPVAIWQYNHRLVLIDDKGMVISKNYIDKFTNLPIIVGKDANLHAEKLFTIMNLEPKLAKQVSSAIWIGDRRWNIRLDSGVEIMLPENDPEGAWLYLADLDKTKKLLKRDIKAVDLRLPDRIYIKTAAITQG